MNIQELKLILETINATTGLAKDVGTTWIWLHYGLQLMGGLSWLVGIAIFVYGFYITIKTCMVEIKDTPFMRGCRDRLQTGTGGCMTDAEYHRTTAKIMELIDKHKADQSGTTLK